MMDLKNFIDHPPLACCPHCHSEHSHVVNVSTELAPGPSDSGIGLTVRFATYDFICDECGQKFTIDAEIELPVAAVVAK